VSIDEEPTRCDPSQRRVIRSCHPELDIQRVRASQAPDVLRLSSLAVQVLIGHQVPVIPLKAGRDTSFQTCGVSWGLVLATYQFIRRLSNLLDRISIVIIMPWVDLEPLRVPCPVSMIRVYSRSSGSTETPSSM
ncbi:hypothetical protein HAX54_023563, partial [Datura stramonium]|nr:hypothetical protein [Datura stramonium]